MAYAQDAALISDVQASAKLLGVAATWASGQALAVADSFLLEMYLLFRLIKELSSHYDVEYLPGSGITQHSFPRGPAPKAGRPRFLLKDSATGATLFQVCAGTKAADINNHQRGIDVSIQTATASDNPVAADVLQLFDAKYRISPTERISPSEFAVFSRWIELFELRGNPTPGLTLGPLSELDANCLVTNGEYSTECDTECARVSLREIARFHPNTTYTARP